MSKLIRYIKDYISISNMVYNEECPICLDSWEVKKEENITLRCNHQFHTECLKGVNKLECPLCKDDLSYLPPEIVDSINYNRERARQDIDLPELDEFDSLLLNMEMINAFNYMASIGVPLNRIDHFNIPVEYDELSSGTVFKNVITSVIDQLTNDDQEDEEDDMDMDGIFISLVQVTQ